MNKNIPELTGLRGIAAFLILQNHLLLLIPYFKNSSLRMFLEISGCMGMSLFFILSGIVIYYNYVDDVVKRKGKGIINFFIARFARLYPLYITFLLINVVKNFFSSVQGSGVYLQANLASFPIFLAGMQSWFYGYINKVQIVRLQGSANITWSISCEFALYFIFIPLAFLLFRFKGVKAALTLFFISITAKAVWMYFSIYDKTLQNALNSIFNHPETSWKYLMYHSPIARFFEFLSGCAIAIYYKANQPASKKMKVCVVFFIIAFAIMLTGYLLKKFTFLACDHILASPISAVLCFATAIFGSKLFRSKALLFMGDVSYSTYLLHSFVVHWLHYRGEHIDSIFATIAGFFIITYTMAWFCYKYFETPMRRNIRAFFADKKEENINFSEATQSKERLDLSGETKCTP